MRLQLVTKLWLESAEAAERKHRASRARLHRIASPFIMIAAVFAVARFSHFIRGLFQ
jgi:hypothetical protein